MAAALIPIIAGLAPEIINLIVGLVHPKAIAAEQLGAATGPVKFADVFVSVMSDLVRAHAAGTIAVLPDEATVKVIIQAVVTSMQLSGYLGGAIAAQALSAQSPLAVVMTRDPMRGPNRTDVALKAGQSLLVTA